MDAIRESLTSKLEEMCELYGLPADKLALLARKFKWDEDRMSEAWFSGSCSTKKLSIDLGMQFDSTLNKLDENMKGSLPANNNQTCLICWEELCGGKTFALDCHHTFCQECTREFLIEKVKMGVVGLDAECMQAGCNMRFGHDNFLQLLTPDPHHKEMYWKWLCKSFTDDNKAIRWCPEPGCEYCFKRTYASA